MQVVSDLYVGGDSVEFTFTEGDSVMAEEVRPDNEPPYWLVPKTITAEQKAAIITYSHLEVRHEHT
jgi:hypothetical protein